MVDTAYRDADRSSLATFAQHVAIAEGMATEYESLMRRAPAEVEDSSDDPLNDFKRQVAFAFEGGWDQLTQARAILVALSRDVAAYDAARANAGDLYLGVVEHRVTGTRRILGPGRRTARLLAWAFRASSPMRAAIAAMRAAAPDVVIPQARPDEPVPDLRASSSKVPGIVLAVAALAGVGYVVMRLMS